MPEPKSVQIDFFSYADRLRRRRGAKGVEIFDPVRKLWLAGYREEVVRQLFVQFLIDSAIAGPGQISIEKEIPFNRMTLRYDIAVHDRTGAPFLLVECKAPEIAIDNNTMAQAATYNLTLGVPYICVTNGITTYLCHIVQEESKYVFLDSFSELTNRSGSHT